MSELDLAGVAARLAATGTPVEGTLQADRIAGGRSNQTFVLREDGVPRWVLRCPPFAGRTPSAHDVAREFRVTSALHGTGVPVAAPLLLCEDESVLGVPFTVVEFVRGRTVRTAEDLASVDDAGLARCIDALVGTLAALHALEPAAIGLGDFGRPDGYAARQLRRWSGQWEHVDGSADARAREAAERLRAALADSVPDQTRAAIVHGDYRIDNTLLDLADPGRVLAVVDWELSTIGDPVADVALMCVYRHPALDPILGCAAAWTSDRLPAVPELAARYEQESGTRLEHWEFHLGLAFYKLAVIAQGIRHRHLAGAEVPDIGDGTVAELLEAGLAGLGS